MILNSTTTNNQILYALNTIDYLYAKGKIYINHNDTIRKAELYGDLHVFKSCVIDTLIGYDNNETRTYMINKGYQLTITDSLSLPVGDCKNSALLTSSVEGSMAKLYKTSGSLTLDGMRLISIEAYGGADFTSNNTVEQDGRNLGWTINIKPSTDYYWVGGTGNWNDPTQWSLTSGGSSLTASDCVPNARINVHFDANSFNAASQTVTLDSTANCLAMDWTGATNSPTIGGNNILNVYGDLTFISAMDWTSTKDLWFRGQGQRNIDLNGLILGSGNIYFDVSDTSNLVDSLHSSSIIYVYRGTLNTNNHKIHCRGLWFTGKDSLYLNAGTSILEADYATSTSYTFYWQHDSMALDVDEATLISKGTSRNNIYMENNGNFVFGNVYSYGSLFTLSGGSSQFDSVFSYSTSSSLFNNSDTFAYIYADNNTSTSNKLTCDRMIVTGNLTTNSSSNVDIGYCSVGGLLNTNADVEFDTLLLLVDGPGTIHQFQRGKTCTINDSFYVNSNGCYKTNIKSDYAGTQATISMPSSSTLNTDFIEVKDMIGIGGGTFNAGGNSADLGNNTGWNFTGPENTLQLKYRYFCIDTPGITIVTAVPDGDPELIWWRETVLPYDTFNTGHDTIHTSNEGTWVVVSSWGVGCTTEDSMFVQVSAKANGVAQVFGNYAGDKDWFNCSNWDQGLIPDSLSDATISSGDTVRILAGDTAICHNLIINGVVEITGGQLHVYGDFANNNVIDQTGGELVLIGSGTDSIRGSSIANIKNLTINKDGDINIATGLRVSGTLEFIKGILYTNASDSLLFETAATTTGAS
ncbi:MAG: hypothetical protein KJO69_09405, partial [Gammaproteobacteria bacterium]|nr:hypothetical protein [Gammaproteobacteria bacterium]